MILFGLVAYGYCFALYYASYSQFDTIKYESVLTNSLSGLRLKDALTDEVFIISYSYNQGQPRFYTKLNAEKYAPDYDLELNEIAMATSATPIFFEPFTRVVKKGRYRNTELLVDGGLIANNPSLYATVYVKEFLKRENVRVVSLGFIPKPAFSESSLYQQMSAIKWV
jgi:patatin-like phospholipase/acyl hydrolase